MNKMFIFTMALCGLFIGCESNNTDIDKILIAKGRIRNMVNYPDTLSFHEFDTNVSGNNVFLKFTCKNAFGVPETHTINVDIR